MRKRGDFVSLDELEVGKMCMVLEVEKDNSMFQRFTDIGIVPGTKIECAFEAPSGEPKAYLIRKALIGIRKNDAKCIKIEVADE